jgi:hypothetical protein
MNKRELLNWVFQKLGIRELRFGLDVLWFKHNTK